MKSLLVFPILYVLVCLAACTKKESAKPATVTNTPGDSGKDSVKAGTTVQVRVNLYPYTDTFMGSLNVKFLYTYYPYDSTDNAYAFYITHPDSVTEIFISSKAIELEPLAFMSVINIRDAVAVNGSGIYTGDMQLFRVDKNCPVLKNAISFTVSGRNLSVSWDQEYVPLLGACDYGTSIGQFTGTQTNER